MGYGTRFIRALVLRSLKVIPGTTVSDLNDYAIIMSGADQQTFCGSTMSNYLYSSTVGCNTFPFSLSSRAYSLHIRSEPCTAMSDPVTILGAIASVASLLKAARTICSWIKDFRNAPAFVRELLVYIEGFVISVEEVQLALSNPVIARKIASAQTHLVIGRAEETLYQLRVTLKDVVQGSRFEVNRSKWVYHQSKCRELQQQLDTYRESLKAIISATHS